MFRGRKAQSPLRENADYAAGPAPLVEQSVHAGGGRCNTDGCDCYRYQESENENWCICGHHFDEHGLKF